MTNNKTIKRETTASSHQSATEIIQSSKKNISLKQNWIPQFEGNSRKENPALWKVCSLVIFVPFRNKNILKEHTT